VTVSDGNCKYLHPSTLAKITTKNHSTLVPGQECSAKQLTGDIVIKAKAAGRLTQYHWVDSWVLTESTTLFYQPLHLASQKNLYLIIIIVYCFDANKNQLASLILPMYHECYFPSTWRTVVSVWRYLPSMTSYCVFWLIFVLHLWLQCQQLLIKFCILIITALLTLTS